MYMANYVFDGLIKTDALLPLSGSLLAIGDSATTIVLTGTDLTLGDPLSPLDITGSIVTLTAGTAIRFSGTGIFLTPFAFEIIDGSGTGLVFAQGANTFLTIDTLFDGLIFARPILCTHDDDEQFTITNSAGTFTNQLRITNGSTSSAKNFLLCSNGTDAFKLACSGDMSLSGNIRFTGTYGSDRGLIITQGDTNAFKIKTTTDVEILSIDSTSINYINMPSALRFTSAGRIYIPTGEVEGLRIMDTGANYMVFRSDIRSVSMIQPAHMKSLSTQYRSYFNMTSSPVTLGASDVVNGLILATGTAGGWNLNLPTGSALLTYLSNPIVGSSFDFYIQNTSGANTLAVTLGADMTALGTTYTPVPVSVMKKYIFRVRHLTVAPYFEIMD